MGKFTLPYFTLPDQRWALEQTRAAQRPEVSGTLGRGASAPRMICLPVVAKVVVNVGVSGQAAEFRTTRVVVCASGIRVPNAEEETVVGAGCDRT